LFMEKKVTIFGSSRAKPESHTYKLAYELGKLLADAGFIVCNGGYMGIMEASLRGAKESGGKTIGVTTQAFQERAPNSWIDEEIKTNGYVERLDRLIHIADAFVVLKGGIGTLSELSLVWTLIAIGEIKKPVILIGDEWHKAIDSLKKNLVIDYHETQALVTLKKPKDAVEFLKRLPL